MSFEYQGENGVSLRRTNCYTHRTHCDSTQPVACIRGYEPSAAIQGRSTPPWLAPGYISGTKTTVMLSYLWSL